MIGEDFCISFDSVRKLKSSDRERSSRQMRTRRDAELDSADEEERDAESSWLPKMRPQKIHDLA